MKLGEVERYLCEKIKTNGAIHLTLLDPEGQSPEKAGGIASEAEAGGTTAIMVGGSTVVSTVEVDDTVSSIKDHVKVPVIVFPNNISSISRYADAIWFMSPLNSSNPYFIIKAHVLGAPLIKRYGKEPIPMAYIVLGQESTVTYIGDIRPLPYDRPNLAAAYALAAQYLGMRFIYLEAGSGAKNPVPVSVIKKVRETVHVPIIVGGGVRDPKHAKERVEAGADGVVTGTLVEEVEGVKEVIGKLVESIKSTKRTDL